MRDDFTDWIPGGLLETEGTTYGVEQRICCKLLIAHLSARGKADAEAVARTTKKFNKPASLKTPKPESIEEVMLDFLRLANQSGRKPPQKRRTRSPSPSARSVRATPALCPRSTNF